MECTYHYCQELRDEFELCRKTDTTLEHVTWVENASSDLDASVRLDAIALEFLNGVETSTC